MKNYPVGKELIKKSADSPLYIERLQKTSFFCPSRIVYLNKQCKALQDATFCSITPGSTQFAKVPHLQVSGQESVNYWVKQQSFCVR